MASVLCVIVAYAAFLTPGYLIAKLLRSPMPVCMMTPLAYIVLLSLVIAYQLCGIPLAFGPMLVAYVVVILALAAAVRVSGRGVEIITLPADSLEDAWGLRRMRWVMLATIVLMGAIFAWRVNLAPLLGTDTRFRWAFLGRQMLAEKSLNFYPPMSGADYLIYFHPDGISPLISSAYWWIWSAWGEYNSFVISPLLVAQLFSMMGILVRLGQAFENRTAGLIAAVVAGVSFETYTAMICGQETSMQMLSMIAMTAVIVTTPRGSWRGMAMAGLMAAVGINAREYGWAWLIIGGVMLLLQRRTWRELVVFASVAVALGGPWYLRNFIRCGNPFYNLTVGPFIGVNPVYNQLMKVYHDLLALPQQGSKQYLEAMYEPVITLPLQLTIGIAASIIWFRRVKLLWVVYVTVLGLWLASVSYTAGGLPYSTRVLGPSHALMAIPVGMVGALLLRSRRALARWAVIVVVAGYMLYTVAIDCAYPYFVPNPFMAVRMVNIPGERPVSDLELADAIVNRYPVGTRILTDNAYIHAAMAGRGRDLVAIWSPEVSFLWDTSLDEPTIRRKLLERRIARVLIYPRSANTPLMMKSNFFAATATSPWYPEIVQEGMLYLVRLEP